MAKAHEESTQLVREEEMRNDSGARMRNPGAQGGILKAVKGGAFLTQNSPGLMWMLHVGGEGPRQT